MTRRVILTDNIGRRIPDLDPFAKRMNLLRDQLQEMIDLGKECAKSDQLDEKNKEALRWSLPDLSFGAVMILKLLGHLSGGGKPTQRDFEAAEAVMCIARGAFVLGRNSDLVGGAKVQRRLQTKNGRARNTGKRDDRIKTAFDVIKNAKRKPKESGELANPAVTLRAVNAELKSSKQEEISRKTLLRYVKIVDNSGHPVSLSGEYRTH